MVIGQYRPGHGPLHRLGTGWKLLGVFLLALLASVPLPVPAAIVQAVTGAVVIALYLVAGLGLGEVYRQILLVRWLILILLISQLIFADPERAYINTARVVVILLAAGLLTLTSRTQDILDALVRILTPLRSIGVDPERVGLALSLTMRTIPQLALKASALRDAQYARGQRVRLMALILPLLVLSMRHADEVADALIARGAGDRKIAALTPQDGGSAGR